LKQESIRPHLKQNYQNDTMHKLKRNVHFSHRNKQLQTQIMGFHWGKQHTGQVSTAQAPSSQTLLELRRPQEPSKFLSQMGYNYNLQQGKKKTAD